MCVRFIHCRWRLLNMCMSSSVIGLKPFVHLQTPSTQTCSSLRAHPSPHGSPNKPMPKRTQFLLSAADTYRGKHTHRLEITSHIVNNPAHVVLHLSLRYTAAINFPNYIWYIFKGGAHKAEVALLWDNTTTVHGLKCRRYIYMLSFRKNVILFVLFFVLVSMTYWREFDACKSGQGIWRKQAGQSRL